MSINLVCSDKFPVPDEVVEPPKLTFDDELRVRAETGDFISQLIETPGCLEMTQSQSEDAAKLLASSLKTRNPGQIRNLHAAEAARFFLAEYAHRLAVQTADVRVALTNKLLELANCGEPKYELKAIELLGKHSDIALFTERSQVSVTYKTTAELELRIREKLERLAVSSDTETVEPIDVRHETVDDKQSV